MLRYNLQLAWRSLFQRRSLTILMIAAVGIGLGVLMTVRTMAYQARQLPAGEKSYSLHFVQMDGRGVEGDAFEQWFDGDAITYRDARMLMGTDTAARQQTYLWKTDVIVSSENNDVLPKRTRGLVGLSNFFEMFDAPFLFGSTWSEAANDSAEPVVVISKDYNDYFFGGENSVGRRLNLGTHTVTVVGVLDDWNINRRYYDMTFDQARRDNVFVSDSLAQELNLVRAVQMGCHDGDAELAGQYASEDIQGLINSECAWVLFWADLESTESIQEYRQTVEQHRRLRLCTAPGKKASQDSLGNREMLVFQQSARLQNVAQELDLLPVDPTIGLIPLDHLAQIGPEVEVQTGPVPDSVTLDQLAQRRLARAGRAQE